MISFLAARYKKGTASAWMLFFFAYEVQTPNHLRAAPAGRMGSRRTKQTTSHTFPRDPVVTSPTSATKRKRDAHCVSLFFCSRSGIERLPAPGYPEVVDEQVKTLRWSVRLLTKPPLSLKMGFVSDLRHGTNHTLAPCHLQPTIENFSQYELLQFCCIASIMISG